MSTVHLEQTTSATPEQFVAGLTGFEARNGAGSAAALR
jgi:hypothetical protein